MDFQAYLSQPYQGHESFLENIIFPIFGEDNYETTWDVELLDSEDLQNQAARTGIRSILRCGTIYTRPTPVDVFDITVSDRVMMDKNRVGVQAIIRRVMDTYSGAFLLIHYLNDTTKWDWRFTFCQLRDKGEFTDNKRYTFLLGPNQACKTAAQNFKKLADLKQNITIKDIVAAFDVEALSKEFFDKYKVHYERFVEYITGKRFVKEGSTFVEKANHQPHPVLYPAFDSNDKAVRDYIKLLLGRITLLHFVQKKGWLGVKTDASWGSGDERFMFNLFSKATEEQKADFVVEVLNPLFFNALDTDRRSCGDVFDSKVFGKIRIPYLNGGLFEKNAGDTIRVQFPAEYFDTLFTFFSEYNFTIDENDPNEAQVGIDPEMLGKIFENLLEDNKDKGAFYTPKEIVRYMCQESLIAFLVKKTQFNEHLIRAFVLNPEEKVTAFDEEQKYVLLDAILNVKICDPAIGSGAFPIGLLNELVRCKEAIYGDEKGRADIKREIIRDNIYGVDIEKGAVDIARLRFWLSLVVDEDTPTPLPNLDYKIMQGNSLLEWFDGVNLSKLADTISIDSVFGGGRVELLKHEMSSLLKQYFGESNHEKQAILKKSINETISKILDISGVELPKDLNLCENNQFFLWHTWFSDVFNRSDDCGGKSGFDIVIGNPPYIKEDFNRGAFDGFRETSPYYMGKMDLWYGFACHSIDMLSGNGSLCFIAQNNWTTSAGAKKLRNHIIKETRILQLLDFNDYMVFGESASIQTMVMLFSLDSTTDDYSFSHRVLLPGASKSDMIDLLYQHNNPNCSYRVPHIRRETYTNKFLTFSLQEDLLDRIASGKTFLTEDEATNGIHPHYDFVNGKINRNHPEFPVGTGIFGLSTIEKDRLQLTSKELELIKPYYTSEQVHRYYTCPENELWIIYTTSEFKNPNSMDPYPHLKTHLDRFQHIISSCNKPYGLHRARKEAFFKNEKIVALRKCVGSPVFSYSDFDCYVSATFYVIKTTRWDMKFLTGLLNSRLIKFWLKNRGKMQGENYQLDKEPLEMIPLPNPTVQQKEISQLVDTIIKGKRDNPDFISTNIEEQIDKLVYEIYGLSSADIEVIESI